jgi:putative peptide zinc metalloprotease protein
MVLAALGKTEAMSRTFNDFWYRVAPLKPRLRSHVEIHRHLYRGQLWYVLEDHSSQRNYRFSPAAYSFIGLFDGQRSIGELWNRAAASLGEQTPTQSDVIDLLAQLHAADALQCDVPPDIGELLLRQNRQFKHNWHDRLLAPLSWRLPLLDPERILERLLTFARPLFGRAGAILWIAVVGTAAVQAATHWAEITNSVSDRILMPQNLALLWLLFPLLKILHEFGHGLATKAYGGEVHEMGVLLVALQPIPYVDVSAASAFRSRRQRIIVGAAGMIVELFIASLALFLWLHVEAGVIRAIAYNVMFIAGVSTVLFNANPLLRYDGYFMLADYLEMPNLRARADAYMTSLCEFYIFGYREAAPETKPLGERFWLSVYPVAAFVYRIIALASIVLFIAGKFFFLGALLAFAGIAAWVVLPLMKLIAYVFANPRIQRVRRRAIAASALLVLAVLGAVFWMPLPLRTRVEGVIWIPDEARLRAKADGFVQRIVARPGSHVRPGDVLIICRDPQPVIQARVLEFRLEELQTRYTAEWLVNPRQAQILKDEIAHTEERLARARERVEDLVIRSRAEGIFELPEASKLIGRFVRQGASLGYVLDRASLTARVVVPEENVDLVRHRTKNIKVRLVDRPTISFSAVIKRAVPAASEQLPTTALGSQGGGAIAVDPSDRQGTKTIEKIFHFDLALPSNAGINTFGGRIYVRFDHGWEPVVMRWHRTLRRLFLSKFYV